MQAFELHLFLWLIAVTLSLKEEACRKATLTLKTWRKTVKFRDNITLVCSINGTFTGLTYHWHKDHQTDWGVSRENTITIPFVTESDSGQYRCAAYTSGPYPGAFSCRSNAVKLSIKGLLTATLMLRDQREPVYIGEDVTLVCSIENGYTGWTYHWYKDGYSDRNKSNEHMVTISSVTMSDSGEYQCAAYRDDRYPVFVSTASNALTLSVHDLLKATLKLKNLRDHVYTGDEVTLICSIEGEHTGWTYRWYKDNQTGWRRSHENSISSVTGSDSGQYQCAAYRDDQPTSVPVSTISNAVTLGVQEREAKLTSNHTGKQIFEGDNVEMMCKVDGNLVDWKYELHKTGDKYPYKEQMKKKKFTISHVTLSDSGEYKCRAVKDNLHSRFSEPVQLQVSGLNGFCLPQETAKN
ncbi:Fc receptor-like protein 3 isoform X1 [Erpetoichthys calabaricus]|uniref:Fc receptor-like protein 3 isoform X1 n=1 Tax=Erpetoichthys calabaricus TaxID=27687 RepID=UPI0022342523|nr:Fc receptor-like protein 3 isoform X1 [Erpetoichthys calabaricus]